MYIETIKDDIKFIVSDKPYFEFEYLQTLAKKNNIKKVIKDFKDEYFVCALLNEEPAYSCTAVNGGLYSPNVLRCSTKFFANPKYVGKTPTTVFKKICQYGTEIFKEYNEESFKKYNFYFISRHPNSSPIKRLYEGIDWIVNDENLYLVGKDSEKSSSWRHIYYSGDINNFNVPKMTLNDYYSKFGNYKFNRNWSDNAIENTKHLFKNNSVKKVLEIGTFEGKYSIWLADNYDLKIHTIDPFKSDIYNLSQSLFNTVEKNWLHNLHNCKNNNKITYYKDYSLNVLQKLIHTKEKFDLIYVDGDHRSHIVMQDLIYSFNMLNDNGIMLIDDAVNWKARDHNTNQILEDETLSPKLAVDSFKKIYKNKVKELIIPKKNQVALQKI
jgi:predicted O-methyltransferase YrrM